MRYFILTEQQATILNAAQKGVERGYARQNVSGEWATAESSKDSFPDLFKWEELPLKELSHADFPQPKETDYE